LEAPRFDRDGLLEVLFQYLKGAIGSSSTSFTDYNVSEFQYLKGAIGREEYCRDFNASADFNTSKVRLEVLVLRP